MGLFGKVSRAERVLIGFNSVGASATINHLHFQILDFQDNKDDALGSDKVLYLENLPSTEVLPLSPDFYLSKLLSPIY